MVIVVVVVVVGVPRFAEYFRALDGLCSVDWGTPVRGLRGPKGNRSSRMSGRIGGVGLIRKWGIAMKRQQEFHGKAERIGFAKYI